MVFNLFLILFIFAELSFYLLIAQTGIIEIFHSNLAMIVYLPIGGLIGTFISANLKIKESFKMFFLLSLQLITVLSYPHLNIFMLFLLGFAVGGISPIIIARLKFATNIDILFALGASYTLGTLAFTSDPFSRELLGTILAILAFIGYLFSHTIEKSPILFQNNAPLFPLYMMVIWVILDSSLFETLSRESLFSIWRDGYSFEIILFHLLGVLAALTIGFDAHKKAIFITLLFVLSYLFYFTKEALLLSFAYPFVISYYNVVILQNLVQVKSLKSIGFFMIFIGWFASGFGLSIALSSTIVYIPLLLVLLVVMLLKEEFYIKKGVILC